MSAKSFRLPKPDSGHGEKVEGVGRHLGRDDVALDVHLEPRLGVDARERDHVTTRVAERIPAFQPKFIP